MQLKLHIFPRSHLESIFLNSKLKLKNSTTVSVSKSSY